MATSRGKRRSPSGSHSCNFPWVAEGIAPALKWPTSRMHGSHPRVVLYQQGTGPAVFQGAQTQTGACHAHPPGCGLPTAVDSFASSCGGSTEIVRSGPQASITAWPPTSPVLVGRPRATCSDDSWDRVLGEVWGRYQGYASLQRDPWAGATLVGSHACLH